MCPSVPDVDWECDPRTEKCGINHPYNPTTTAATTLTTTAPTVPTAIATTVAIDPTTSNAIGQEPSPKELGTPANIIINFNPILKNNINGITIGANSTSKNDQPKLANDSNNSEQIIQRLKEKVIIAML